MADRRTAKKPKPRKRPAPKKAKSAAWTPADRQRFTELLGSLPVGLLESLIGKQRSQIKRQATVYGLAYKTGPCDLRAFMHSIFDLLAKISPHYQRWLDGGGDLPGSRETPSLERGRMAKAELAELQLEERRGLVIPREDVHEGLMEFAKVLRGAGDRLQRQHGSAAYEILDDALTSAIAAVERTLAERNGKHRGAR